jgi:predicted TIM-barrel fold metal-dependent hydrolase
VIIDCHVHLNKYDSSDPSTLADRFENLKRDMALNGVEYAIILSSYTTNEQRPSLEEILDVVGDDKRFGVVAGVSYKGYTARDLADLRTLLREKRIKGLKLYPGYEPFFVGDARLRVLYELAGEFKVPVMIHTGDTWDKKAKLKYAHPLQVDDVAVDFPEVTFVICHLGNPWITDAMEVIYKNANVVADLSGFTIRGFERRFQRFMLEQVNEVVAFAGNPSRLLFGTDWPICDIGPYIEFVRNLELSDSEHEQVFWQNTVRVFNLDLPKPA